MTEEPAEKFWTREEGTDEQTKPVGKKIPPKKKSLIKEPAPKSSLDGEKVRNGLAQLILTVVELLRELMEKQALRRIEAGSLSDEQVENLGNTFMSLKTEVEKLRQYFQLEDEDLNLELGPLNLSLRGETTDEKASVVEILDRLLVKGVVVRGDVVLSVADVDLVSLNLGLLLASIDKAKELYSAPDSARLEEEVRKLRAENEKLKNISNKVERD